MGAQNVHSDKGGAYTGEVSVSMIKEVGCSHVIVGHSERRHLLGETDSFINAKMKAVLAAGLKPIFLYRRKVE